MGPCCWKPRFVIMDITCIAHLYSGIFIHLLSTCVRHLSKKKKYVCERESHMAVAGKRLTHITIINIVIALIILVLKLKTTHFPYHIFLPLNQTNAILALSFSQPNNKNTHKHINKFITPMYLSLPHVIHKQCEYLLYIFVDKRKRNTPGPFITFINDPSLFHFQSSPLLILTHTPYTKRYSLFSFGRVYLFVRSGD